MATPTITTTGTLSGLLLITDHESVSHRVPLSSIDDVSDTSNSSAYRIEILTRSRNITLVFANASEVTAALAAIDALY